MKDILFYVLVRFLVLLALVALFQSDMPKEPTFSCFTKCLTPLEQNALFYDPEMGLIMP